MTPLTTLFVRVYHTPTSLYSRDEHLIKINVHQLLDLIITATSFECLAMNFIQIVSSFNCITDYKM